MNLTVLFILIVIIIVAIYDVWVIKKKGKPESISAHIIRISKTYPLITLLTGILLGHLFWSMPTESVYENMKCVKEGNGPVD